ncbi:1959_t:CDS:2 [Funneliformis geosporum]|uniref:1959_t:CDS:1 n=1 Tax=Funneliformis geosporum TaxID=1117311 RepID=A0A9W4SQR9_9GLOM|nr:1959_t:CDS:2 [Funneliformis geosporum]
MNLFFKFGYASTETNTGILLSVITLLSLTNEKQNDDDNLNLIEEIQKLLDQYNNFTFSELMNAEKTQ